ncbi:MAG: flagellar hook-associated protein FlgK [Acidobacteria bacterium]|nr:flagellar hook-associated protein FlgK [Acidobacteriota bacterium]
MPSILDGLDNVQQALAAQQYALSITQKNIANAGNPSYTRQDVIFTNSEEPEVSSGIPGIYLQSKRNQFLDSSISQELQSSGGYEFMSEALSQIESIMKPESGVGLQEAISEFFGSFNTLSSTPEDLVARQQVLSSAEVLTVEFHRLYAGLQQLQASEDRMVPQIVQEINVLTAEIASLNEKIPAAKASQPGSELTLRDERQKCLEELSGLMGIDYFETESGSITVTTRQGAALVLDNTSYDLETAPMVPSPLTGIQLNGTDITASMNSGKLGGLLRVRDETIADCLQVLDVMAATLVERVNQQHTLGSDLDGLAGGDFFVPFVQPAPGSNEGAARHMQVALSDPRSIAAAGAAGGPGDNENAKSIFAIEDEKLFSTATETINQFFSGFIFRIGSEARSAEDNMITHNGVIEQLMNQRDADIGVNLDEEAINIIKFQKAYEASARYANTLVTLSDELINLLGG